MITQNSYTTKSWSIGKLARLFKEGKIKLDLAFQRTFSWKEKAQISFISSIFDGVFPGQIIFTDNKKNVVEDKYFPDLAEEGYDFLSIDGNGRTNTVVRFISNQFPIKRKGRLYYFKDFSSDIQNKFLSIDFSVLIYNNITRDDCRKVFINHNESKPLSPQEFRNANLGRLPEWFRDTELLMRDKVRSFGINNLERKNDEYILDMLLRSINPELVVGKPVRDKYWYGNIDNISFNEKFLIDSVKLLGELQFKYEIPKQKEGPYSIDFSILRGFILQENLSIVDKDEFFKYFHKLHMSLRASNKTYPVIDKTTGLPVAVPYAHLLKYPAYQDELTVRVRILKSVVEEMINNGILFEKSERRLDTTSPKLRFLLTERQNFTCTSSGDKIEDYTDADKWEVDHIIPIAKGGADELFNLRLIRKADNRKKGAKLVA